MKSDRLEDLVVRAQAGEVRAFEELVRAHLPQVRRFARAFCGSEQDADDLAQEALIKVYKNLRSFKYQSAFSSWLYALVRNVFLDFAKSRSQRTRASEQGLDVEPLASSSGAPPSGADDQLIQEENRKRLWVALRQVPVEFRTALVLFDLEGHSYDEVAAIEKVPVGTVRSRLSRGREHLRRLLNSQSDSEDLERAGTSHPAGSSHPRRSGP